MTERDSTKFVSDVCVVLVQSSCDIPFLLLLFVCSFLCFFFGGCSCLFCVSNKQLSFAVGAVRARFGFGGWADFGGGTLAERNWVFRVGHRTGEWRASACESQVIRHPIRDGGGGGGWGGLGWFVVNKTVGHESGSGFGGGCLFGLSECVVDYYCIRLELRMLKLERE